MILSVISAIAFGVIAVNGYNAVEEHYQIVAQEQEAAKVAQVYVIDEADGIPVLLSDLNQES